MAPEKEKFSKRILSIVGTMAVNTPEPAEVMPNDKALYLSKYGPYAVNVVNVTIPAPSPETCVYS